MLRPLLVPSTDMDRNIHRFAGNFTEKIDFQRFTQQNIIQINIKKVNIAISDANKMKKYI